LASIVLRCSYGKEGGGTETNLLGFEIFGEPFDTKFQKLRSLVVRKYKLGNSLFLALTISKVLVITFHIVYSQESSN
jgi:hypothetical protein